MSIPSVMNRRWIVAVVGLAILLSLGLWLSLRRPAADVAPTPKPTASVTLETDESGLSRQALEPPPIVLQAAVQGKDEDTEHGSLAGRVLDSRSNHSITGAEVTFLHHGAAHAVESSADGSFLFVAPAAGTYELASVTADGYADFAPRIGQSPVSFTARPRIRIREVVITLQPLQTVRGVVIDAAKQPVAGAEIRAVRLEWRGTSEETPPETQSDGRGQFTLAITGGVVLVATHPDHLPGRTLIDEASAATQVTIELRGKAAGARWATLTGQVIDPDGAPASGARVEATPAGHRPRDPHATIGGGVFTDLTGRFTLRVLSGGEARYAVRASASGYADALAEAIPADGPPLTLRLRRGLSLSGRVFDQATGRGVPSFQLFLQPEGPRYAAESRSVLDAEGRFTVLGLEQGSYLVRVAAYGYAPSAPATVKVTEATTHDVGLTRGGRVFGLVIDGVTRRPVAGARVTVEGEPYPEDVIAVQATAITDAAGRFALDGVAGGLRSLRAAAEQYHTRLLSGLRAESDGTVQVTIDLTPRAEGEAPQTELVGIGASLSSGKDGARLISILPGGGAELEGLVPGDLLLAVDGQSLRGLPFTEVIELIRGQEDSVVLLTVRRADGTTAEIRVPRRRVRF